MINVFLHEYLQYSNMTLSLAHSNLAAFQRTGDLQIVVVTGATGGIGLVRYLFFVGLHLSCIMHYACPPCARFLFPFEL